MRQVRGHAGLPQSDHDLVHRGVGGEQLVRHPAGDRLQQTARLAADDASHAPADVRVIHGIGQAVRPGGLREVKPKRHVDLEDLSPLPFQGRHAMMAECADAPHADPVSGHGEDPFRQG